MSEDDSLELERMGGTPSGWKAKMKGRDPFPYLIIAGLLLAIVYMATFNLKLWGDPFDLKQAMQRHDVSMDQQHTNYINGVSELTYVMSVCLNQATQDQCQRLRLNMPDSLYRKLNNAQQP